MDIQLSPKPWYMKHRWFLLSAAAFVVLLAWLVVSLNAPKTLRVSAEDAGISEATLSDFTEYVYADGTLQPFQTIRVNVRESGYVSRVVAEEGAQLRVGDTILVLTNPELERTIADERREWTSQQNNHREKLIEMEQQRLTLEQQALQNDYELSRLEKQWALDQEEYRMGIKSQAELQVSEEEYTFKRRSAELQRERGEQDRQMATLRRDMLERDLEAAHSKLLRSEARLADLVVTAPVDGQLSAIDVVIGQQLGSGNAIAELKIMEPFKLHASLGEYHIDKVIVGQPATVKADDCLYALHVSHIVPEVKERTFAIDLLFNDSIPSGARIGKSYQARLELSSAEPAVTIPKGNFYSFTGGQWIFRLDADGHTATRIPIIIGRQNPVSYEVIEGLQPGDRVVTSGYDRFGDAARIVIK